MSQKHLLRRYLEVLGRLGRLLFTQIALEKAARPKHPELVTSHDDELVELTWSAMGLE